MGVTRHIIGSKAMLSSTANNKAKLKSKKELLKEVVEKKNVILSGKKMWETLLMVTGIGTAIVLLQTVF